MLQLRHTVIICLLMLGGICIADDVSMGKRATPRAKSTAVKQLLQRQTQRRVTGTPREVGNRSSAATKLQMRDRGRYQQTNLSNASAQRSQRDLERHAKQHAKLHDQITLGLKTGRPWKLDDQARKSAVEIFGDAELLTNQAEQQSLGRNGKSKAIAGLNANPRARLANAIRVRRAQISALRDRAIETGDEKLLARADQHEQKLETFLQNQARVEENLQTVRDRLAARVDGQGSDAVDLPPSPEPTPETAPDSVTAPIDQPEPAPSPSDQ